MRFILFQDLETQTIPPPRANFSEQVMQWVIYDAYQQDFEAQQREKEKDKKDKVVSTQKLEVKRKDLETTSDITNRNLLAMKTLERMINQNTFDEIAQGKSWKMWIRCSPVFLYLLSREIYLVAYPEGVKILVWYFNQSIDRSIGQSFIVHSSNLYKVQQKYWIPNLSPNNTEIHNIFAISKLMSHCQRRHRYNMRNIYNQLKFNTIISQCVEERIVTKQ